MRATLAAVLLVLLLAASCGSRTGSLLLSPADDSAGRQAGSSDDFEGWADWQLILENPGIAGIDYDPGAITVNYRSDASFELNGNFAPPPGHRAADKPNQMLRQDSRYEEITDNISGRFGMGIDQQVYGDGVLMASFRMPGLMDGEYVINSIRAEYAGQVLDVTYSRLIQACFSPNDRYYTFSTPDLGGQWGMQRIGVPAIWQHTLGDAQILVGVVDSGCLLSHEDIGAGVLDPRIAFPTAACDLVDGDNDITDSDGHGTAICAILAAETNNIHGLAAVLPAGRVLPLRVAGSSATSQAQIVAGCMLAAQLGCRIVNLSWAASSGSRQLSEMCASLDQRGVLLMAAAGNTGNSTPRYPASYLGACGVSACTPEDSLAADASFGSWTDLSAPGTGFSVPGISRSDSYLQDAAGSSLACALASGAAALLLAHDPQLGARDIRELLTASALPLEGAGAPRIDLSAALASLSFPKISLPAPDRLLQSDFLDLQPQVAGDPQRLDLWIDNVYKMSRNHAPWQLTADLRELVDGAHTLELRAMAAGGMDYSSAGFSFITSNVARQLPVGFGFETAVDEMYELDLGSFDAALAQSLTLAAALPGPAIYAPDGSLNWQQQTAAPWQGQHSLAIRLNAENREDSSLHALLSPAISLTGFAAPTLSLASHWSLPDAAGAMLISVDGGMSWVLPLEQSAKPASFTGIQQDWRQLRFDLSQFAGQQIRLLFLVQRPAGSQTPGQDWWLDGLSIATEFQASLPLIDEVQLGSPVVGALPGLSSLEVKLSGAQNVQSARYWLDVEPLGEEGGADVIASAILGSQLPASLSLAGLSGRNWHAVLRVDYVDAQGSHGPRINLPVWIFNQPGDANADGIVTEADFAMFAARLGQVAGDPGYDPFLDSNLDGVITELDAAAVGYNLSQGKAAD